jgi:hypothetical protein
MREASTFDVGTTIAVRKLGTSVLLAVDRLLQGKDDSYTTVKRDARFPKIIVSSDSSFVIGSWGLMEIHTESIHYQFPEWVRETVQKSFETVSAIAEEVRARATQTFSAGVEQFVAARAKSGSEGKYTVGFIIAGRIAGRTEVYVVTVLHPEDGGSIPAIEVEEISEGDYMAGQTRAINKVLADDQTEKQRFGTVYQPVRNAISRQTNLSGEMLEEACQLVSFIALESAVDPGKVGGGCILAWTTEGEPFRSSTLEPFF